MVDSTDDDVIDDYMTYLHAKADHEKRERKEEEMMQRLKDKAGRRGI